MDEPINPSPSNVMDQSASEETTTTDTLDPSENASLKPKLSDIVKAISTEPIMFLHMLGMAGSGIVVQNMYIDRVCRLNFDFDVDVCKDLSSHRDEEDQVDKTVAVYTTYRGLIEAGFPILFSLFLGPWTDVHGTKYPILVPLLGYFLSAVTYIILTFYPDLPPGFILFASIPVALTGGMVALIMSVFSFMSKITSLENRSFRIAILEASWFLGSPIGLVAGGYIYKYWDFRPVFVASGSLYLISLIYGAIIIKEDKPVLPDREVRNCCYDMFNVSAVKNIFSTIIQERPGKSRRWMIIMLATICGRIFILFGYLNTMYLYTRHQFSWTLKDYTEYSVADSFIAVTGSYVMIMVAMRIFNLKDSVIGIIGSTGSVLGAIVFATASADWMIYAGAALSMFSGLITIVIRAMLSKIVAKEEIAKVFTFLACGEAAMPLISVPLYNLVFINTISWFPGAVFLISVTAYGMILLSFIYLYISMKNYTVHVQMEEESTA